MKKKNYHKLVIEELVSLNNRIAKSKIHNNSSDPDSSFMLEMVENFDKDGNLNSLNEEKVNTRTINSLIKNTSESIILSHPGVSSKQILGRQFFLCQKQLLLAEILLNLGYLMAPLYVAEKLTRESKKYFFLQISFQAYRIIYTLYNRLGDVKSELKANKEFLNYLKYYEVEKKIELARNELFLHYNKSQEKKQNIIDKCDSILQEFSPYENIIPSFYFHNYFYFIKYVKYLNENNNELVYDNAKTAVHYFERLSFEYLPGKLIFTFVQISYCIQKRKFYEGEQLLQKAYSYVSPEMSLWFRLKENELILFFHNKEYNKCISVYFEVMKNRSLSSMIPSERAKWHLYDAYTRLLIESKVVNYQDRKKHFSIQRFLNDLPTFSKDKRAMNIPLLIAQMSFLIIRGEYSKAIDRIEALEKYSSRYLKNSDTFRSNCFIKMLVVIAKQGFNRKAVERHAKKFYDRMINSEIELIDQPFEIEIIPYENLWELLLDHLSQKHHFKNAR
ncbi:MAG: hypothetical protein ACJA01_000595 [Saprospiraceae bacterium]|jgi:hypothetical protein